MSQTELMQRSILFLNWLYSTRNKKSHRGIKPWGYPPPEIKDIKNKTQANNRKTESKGQEFVCLSENQKSEFPTKTYWVLLGLEAANCYKISVHVWEEI